MLNVKKCSAASRAPLFGVGAMVLALLGGTTMSHAAGPEPVQPAPIVIAPAPQVPSWDGAYVGVQLGYAYGDFSLETGDFDDDSIIGGLNAGYLWGIGNGWYLGPELQYDWADMSITDPDTDDSASFDEIARLKLLVGRELGSGLLYGSAGLAYGSIDGVDDFFDGSDGSYVVGVGYDWLLGENWSLGLEYQYHDFDGIGDDGGDVGVNTIHVKSGFRF